MQHRIHNAYSFLLSKRGNDAVQLFAVSSSLHFDFPSEELSQRCITREKQGIKIGIEFSVAYMLDSKSQTYKKVVSAQVVSTSTVRSWLKISRMGDLEINLQKR